MSSPFMPSPISYDDAPAGGSEALMIVAPRDPSALQDVSQPSGYLWLSDLTSGGSGTLFVQAGFSRGTPSWTAQLTANQTGQEVLTGVSIDADAAQTFTISNPLVKSTSKIMATIQGATSGAALSVQEIVPRNGEFDIIIQNGTGATTSTADITVTYIILA